MAQFDLLIRGGQVQLHWGSARTDIGVRNGRIASLVATSGDTAAETIDARGLHVLPGLIDPYVHFRDPGDSSIETIATGSRAAVLGGLTTVFDMPNTAPPATSAAALAAKRAHVERASWCEIGLYVGGTRDNTPELAALEAEPGICAIKVFAASATGALMIEDDAGFERIMRSGHRHIAYHSEDEYRLRERADLYPRGTDYANHMRWRDPETAFRCTRRLIALARATRRPAHLLHVSTAEELGFLREHRDVATVEVLVNHLTQIAPDAYERLRGFAVMNPPIRDRAHWEAAWTAVRDGTVDTLRSDHAPHPRAAKAAPWPDCPSGLTGVQTIVPVMFDHVNAGRLSLARLCDLMAAGVARVYGLLGKGRIAAGYDADFTIVDMKRSRITEESWIVSPCGWTPFAGERVTGGHHHPRARRDARGRGARPSGRPARALPAMTLHVLAPGRR